jgi:hypothetical protein
MTKAICTSCNVVFAGDSSFDLHRVLLPKSEDPDPPTRRCLSLEEMAAGLPKRRDGYTTWRRNGMGWLTHRAEGPLHTYGARQDRAGAPE